MNERPRVDAFFHRPSCTVSYVVTHEGRAAIIDPALDYDAASGRTGTQAADELIAFVRAGDYRVDWLLETHIHADHITAAPYLRQQLGGKVGIGARVVEVQKTFQTIFNLNSGFAADGSQFDQLFGDGDTAPLGGLAIEVLHSPGHTPACVCYHIGDALFVGDTIFMPDFGTARCDFPGGDAATLYRSIRRLLEMPPETRIFVGHDYAPGGRGYAWESTVARERADNRHVRDGIDEASFVTMRRARDAELSPPTLILPAVQVNIRGGALPPAEENGVAYLKTPLNLL
ncbi:MBL fold metallo-hydrolase [bacterium AH-315-B06]|nr:MBL fold metallo-hydrolase [bacterium AH-315-B06]